MKSSNFKSGFTLIELMITMAIIGILASIAYPSYQDSVLKSRRADAKGALLGLANAMERHFTETGSYLGAAPGILPDDETATYYLLTIEAATRSTYRLQATPTEVQSNDSCGNLELLHTGEKLPTTAGCW